MGSYAPYVANRNPESMELHKRECEWAHRIAFRNRVYYCELKEALAQVMMDAHTVCLNTMRDKIYCCKPLVCSFLFFSEKIDKITLLTMEKRDY